MVKIRKINIITGRKLNLFIDEVTGAADTRIERIKVQCEEVIADVKKDCENRRLLDRAMLEKSLHANAVLQAKLGGKIHERNI